ncbi:MAG: 4-(cytidine 5'-diphospho)-2-C-methyl-D-erythritol kinase [Clostridiales bacterium]|nr:4-(cytidine 5'-diphospho)-2-C-methyl-D-erythritol kinase [Clostridiales bacterium]
MPVTVNAPAKINLSLDVGERRDDGYHLIDTVMQTVSLYDTVTVWESDGPGVTLTLTGDGAGSLPADGSNTACRAAAAFCSAAGIAEPAFGIRVHKRIPFAAGMAGGSADAAGVLTALNELTGARLPQEELCRIGGRIGADVPFCLLGGTARATGIGTILTPLPDLPDCYIVVVKPSAGVSTAEAYRAVDAAFGSAGEDGKSGVRHPHTSSLIDGVCAGDLSMVGRELCNVFEEAVRLPAVESIKAHLRRFRPLGCLMTGSGSAVFGLFGRLSDAERCADSLSRSPLPAADRSVFLCRPTADGPVMVTDNALSEAAEDLLEAEADRG